MRPAHRPAGQGGKRARGPGRYTRRRLTPPESSLLTRLERHQPVLWHLLLVGLLPCIAGAVNASGFFIVGQYTSHVTGSVGHFGDELAQGHFLSARIYLAIIGAFFVGRDVLDRAAPDRAQPPRPRALRLPARARGDRALRRHLDRLPPRPAGEPPRLGRAVPALVLDGHPERDGHLALGRAGAHHPHHRDHHRPRDRHGERARPHLRDAEADEARPGAAGAARGLVRPGVHPLPDPPRDPRLVRDRRGRRSAALPADRDDLDAPPGDRALAARGVRLPPAPAAAAEDRGRTREPESLRRADRPLPGPARPLSPRSRRSSRRGPRATPSPAGRRRRRGRGRWW